MLQLFTNILKRKKGGPPTKALANNKGALDVAKRARDSAGIDS